VWPGWLALSRLNRPKRRKIRENANRKHFTEDNVWYLPGSAYLSNRRSSPISQATRASRRVISRSRCCPPRSRSHLPGLHKGREGIARAPIQSPNQSASGAGRFA
jgi:hypothetical protein